MSLTKENATETAVFLLRVIPAIIFIQAGGLKLFGWFGGMPEGIALTPLITIAALLEVFGGAALLIGIFTRPIAFILSGEMAVAYFMGHFPQGVFPAQNHGEPAVLLCFIFLFFAAYGAGKWSVDAAWKQKLNSPLAAKA